MELYNREEHLKEQLNIFLKNGLGLPNDDYYSNLNLDEFLQLKSILSNINNIFTLKVSLSFANWIVNEFKLNQKISDEIISEIISTKPNANGFDIEISEPINLIAEIKCNIPINGGTTYGSAQKNGINKDINALINGKSKSSINPNDYYKFMVFLDKPEVKRATEHFVKNIKLENSNIVFINENTKFDSKKNIYIVYVSI